MQLTDILEYTKNNLMISDSFTKADSVFKKYQDQNIVCSVSGGADSDIMIDICEKLIPGKVKYVWFNTGIEYAATKEHLSYLEKRYNIIIDRPSVKEPVPLSNKKYGQPFLSKYASMMIARLQKIDFDFANDGYKSFDELMAKYGKMKTGLRYWTNGFDQESLQDHSRFSIGWNKYLKEFMITNPPTFKISDKCCNGAKKKPSSEYVKSHDVDLMLVGVRKAEGGIRSSGTAYSGCFSDTSHYGCAMYRPLYWYSSDDRKEYEKLFHIVHSRCYTEYGLIRTGCAGCPYGQKCAEEKAIIETFEPKLSIAINNIFKDSYEYAEKFIQFKKEMKEKGIKAL